VDVWLHHVSMKVMCGHLVALCKYEGDVWTFGCIM